MVDEEEECSPLEVHCYEYLPACSPASSLASLSRTVVVASYCPDASDTAISDPPVGLPTADVFPLSPPPSPPVKYAAPVAADC